MVIRTTVLSYVYAAGLHLLVHVCVCVCELVCVKECIGVLVCTFLLPMAIVLERSKVKKGKEITPVTASDAV